MDHDERVTAQEAVRRAEVARDVYLRTSPDNEEALESAHNEYVDSLGALGQPEPQVSEPESPVDSDPTDASADSPSANVSDAPVATSETDAE